MLKLGAKRDLTDSERKRLHAIWQESDLSQSDIAKSFGVSITRLIRECGHLDRLDKPRPGCQRRRKAG